MSSHASSRCLDERAKLRCQSAASGGRSRPDRGCHAASSDWIGAWLKGRPPGRCHSHRRALRATRGAQPVSPILTRSSGRTGSAWNRARPAPRRAPVGHASRHRVHEPHCSSPWVSGSSGIVQMISARKSHDPSFGLIRHVFLPIHPSPASARRRAPAPVPCRRTRARRTAEARPLASTPQRRSRRVSTSW